jgi:hypothetical protein
MVGSSKLHFTQSHPYVVGTTAQAQEDEAITMQVRHTTRNNRGIDVVVLWESSPD